MTDTAALSPEVREEIRSVLASVPVTERRRYDGETIGYVLSRDELAERETDAILARFSVPSQPVYDEEKIARWLYEEFSFAGDVVSPKGLAAALVAALRGGELTREETSRG